MQTIGKGCKPSRVSHLSDSGENDQILIQRVWQNSIQIQSLKDTLYWTKKLCWTVVFLWLQLLSFLKKSYVVRYRSQWIWTTHELFYFYNKGYICFFVCLTNSMSVWYFTKYEICSSYRYRVVFTTQSKIHESFFAKIAVFSS